MPDSTSSRFASQPGLENNSVTGSREQSLAEIIQPGDPAPYQSADFLADAVVLEIDDVESTAGDQFSEHFRRKIIVMVFMDHFVSEQIIEEAEKAVSIYSRY